MLKNTTPQDFIGLRHKFMQIAKEIESKSVQNDNIVVVACQAQLANDDNPIGEKQVVSGLVPENFKAVH